MIKNSAFWSFLLLAVSAFVLPNSSEASWIMPSQNLVPRTSTLTRSQQHPRPASLISRKSRSSVGSRPSPPAARRSSTTTTTRLHMYNLPPGKNDNDSDLADVAKGVLGFALLVGFFVSPLGGFVLSIFNSFLILSVLLPVGAVVAFQAWQYFNTISAPCPSCSVPLKVLKNNDGGEQGPPAASICYNCGAVVQANYENTGIDNVSGRKSVMDDDDGSGFGSFLDIFAAASAASGGTSATTTTSSTSTTAAEKKKDKNKFRREQTIIDADVEEDKPFQ